MLQVSAGVPLQVVSRRWRSPRSGEALIRVEACGVCRTDLHLRDGELPHAAYPRIPGHEVVGRVIARGAGSGPAIGARVGVAWLASACGRCRFCRDGRENLCSRARFTGCQVDGGYADYCLARADYLVRLPDDADAASLAPLLCAGLIGYRSLKFCGDARRLGLYGFGAAGHLVCQVARAQGRRVYAFTRPGDRDGQTFARRLGAAWAGGSDESPPRPLDAAIIFAPVGALVPMALAAVAPGGTVVCAGIHMSDIPGFAYRRLWQERRVQSVANLTRADAREFFALVKRTPLRSEVTEYPLDAAETALGDLRAGRLTGAAVLRP